MYSISTRSRAVDIFNTCASLICAMEDAMVRSFATLGNWVQDYSFSFTLLWDFEWNTGYQSWVLISEWNLTPTLGQTLPLLKEVSLLQRQKCAYVGPFHHCFSIIFHKYTRGKIGLGKKKLLTWLLVLVLLLLLLLLLLLFFFFLGGGGTGEQWHQGILRSWNHTGFS